MSVHFGAQTWRRSTAVLLGSALAIPATGMVAPQLASAADQPQTITQGSATWGVKESFRKYVTSPMSGGKIDLSQGLQAEGNTYRWSPASGSVDTAALSGTVALGGKVHFTGHALEGKPVLDLSIQNLRVAFDHGRASLVVDADSRPFTSPTTQNPIKQLRNVTVATFIEKPTISGQSLSLNATPTLTKEGEQIFGGSFYPQGTALDQLSLQASLKAPATPTTPAPTTPAPTTPAPAKPAPTTPAPTTAPVTQAPVGQPSTTTAPITRAPASQAPAATTAPKGPVTHTCTVPGARSGSLDWGVKSSFRSYITSGIAKGGWTTSGATYSADRFHWPLQQSSASSVQFGGSVRFTGHDGVLDVRISNVRVNIAGSNQASLVADVDSSDMSGTKSHHAGVTMATLRGSISVRGADVSAKNLDATLTAEGAKAFAGFYSAGAGLDPVSFSSTTSTRTATCDEQGKVVAGLPKTGVDTQQQSEQALLALALAGLLAASVVIARRTLQQA